MIEAIVEIVDPELDEDKEYASMGKKPADRVKSLIGKLDSVRRSQVRRSEVSGHSKALFHKFVKQLEKILKNLPKPMEWLSFLNNDLPLLMDFCEKVWVGNNPHHRLPLSLRGRFSPRRRPPACKAYDSESLLLQAGGHASFEEIMRLQPRLKPGHKHQWGNTPEAYKSGSL